MKRTIIRPNGDDVSYRDLVSLSSNCADAVFSVLEIYKGGPGHEEPWCPAFVTGSFQVTKNGPFRSHIYTSHDHLSLSTI